MGALGEPVDVEFSKPIFIPSHLTLGLLGVGVSVAAAGVSVGAAGYALWQFRQTNWEEIRALVKGG